MISLAIFLAALARINSADATAPATAAGPRAAEIAAASRPALPAWSLALNWKAEPQFGGFYAAELKGEFKRRNLEIKIQEGGAGTPTVQMVAAGTVDFAVVSGDEFLIARERGADLVALFAVFQVNPQAIMARAERGFKTLKELLEAHDVLAWQEGLPYVAYLRKKYPQLRVRTVPYTGGIGNFVSDAHFSQQCFSTSEPILAQRKHVATRVFLVSDEGFNPYTTVLVARRKMIQENRPRADAFLQAVRAGWNDYLDHPSRTNEHMAQVNPSMDLLFFKESATLQAQWIRPTKGFSVGSMVPERWQKLADQLRELKILSRPVVTSELMPPEKH